MTRANVLSARKNVMIGIGKATWKKRNRGWTRRWSWPDSPKSTRRNAGSVWPIPTWSSAKPGTQIPRQLEWDLRKVFCLVKQLGVPHLAAFNPLMRPTLRSGQGRLLQQRPLFPKRERFVARRLCPQCSLRFQHSDAEPTSDDSPASSEDTRVMPNSGRQLPQFPPRPPRIYVDRNKAQGTGQSLQFMRSTSRPRPVDDSNTRHLGRVEGRITNGPLSEIDRDIRQVSQVRCSEIPSLIG